MIDESKGAGSSVGPAPFLSLRDAVVRRNGTEILSVEKLDLAEGESIALLGPNGAGKSTFVNLITREVLPLYRDEPPVRFRGDPRAMLVDVRRALGIVSASTEKSLFVSLPVRDIVASGLTGTIGLPIQGSEAAAAHARAAATEPLEALGIAELVDRPMTTLSTGQVRRVMIARALVSNPDVLVFDEPTTGLDPEGMYYVRQAMEQLAEAGKGIVLVTHYPEDIIASIERLLLLKDGRIFVDGPKDQLLTSETMSRLFDAPLSVVREGERYFLA